jgi:hypothetical protein
LPVVVKKIPHIFFGVSLDGENKMFESKLQFSRQIVGESVKADVVSLDCPKILFQTEYGAGIGGNPIVPNHPKHKLGHPKLKQDCETLHHHLPIIHLVYQILVKIYHEFFL